MKDPPFACRHKKPKLKLICCFNGAFQRRPPAGTLRYVGGEIRIVSVDRSIGFSKLKSKILDLYTGPRSFSLIYHLRVDEDTPLALIKSENDVFCMIEEYEKFETLGKHPRLWIFVFNDGYMVNVRVNLRDYFLNDDSSRVSLLNGDRKRTIVKKQGFSCSSVDSLRKIVLKQQLLANHSEKLHSNQNRTNSRLTVEETGVDFGTMPDNDNHSFISLTNKSNTLLEDDDPHKMNASDIQLGRMPISHSLPLNPGDGNGRVKSNISLNSHLRLGDGRDLHSKSQSSGFGEVKSSCECSGSIWSNKNRENVIPRGLGRNRVRGDFVAPSYYSNQLVGGGYPSKSAHANSHNGIRSHRFDSNDLRHLRACPYQFRGRKNTLNEMRNLKLIRLDRGHPVESVGLKSISHVSKHGQDMGSYYHTPCKPSSCFHIEKVEQMASTTDSGLNRQIHLCNVPSQDDQHGGLQQTLRKTLLKGTTNDEPYCDTKKETNLISQPEVLSISTFSNNTGSINETEIRSNDKLLDKETGCKSLISHQNSDHTLQGGIECSLAVSLHNLSLTSTQKEKLITTHVATAIDIPEVSWKPNSDIVHEEQFSSGLQVEKSSKATSISFKIDEENDEKGDVQQKPQSNSTLNDKARETQHKCLKINGGIPNDLATFYTHLAIRELQTINNSDLEYIKELGSGSYGAVFYGKWKGSDVAIKKIKPSCFSEGAMEEDRLVAGFWKEVHILGQLHHPNIVALYGVVTGGPVTNLAAVTEYMVNGSLKQVLRRKDRTIDRRKRIIIAMDAAFGMEYIHGKNIVHFDLKSHNFLVNMRNPWRPVCKIGDLGLSKIKQNTLVSGGVRGTIPWMAPELLKTEKMVTEKVDVYSFGIVMWELLTGEEPYANMHPEEIIAGIIRGTLRPKIPDWCDPMWRSLMERCWSTDPDSRPGFPEIAKELRAMAAAMNIT